MEFVRVSAYGALAVSPSDGESDTMPWVRVGLSKVAVQEKEIMLDLAESKALRKALKAAEKDIRLAQVFGDREPS